LWLLSMSPVPLLSRCVALCVILFVVSLACAADDAASRYVSSLLSDGVSWVRFRALPQRSSLGFKRMLAASMARGSVIVHWSENDMYAADRVEVQASAVLQGQAHGEFGAHSVCAAVGVARVCLRAHPASSIVAAVILLRQVRGAGRRAVAWGCLRAFRARAEGFAAALHRPADACGACLAALRRAHGRR
jgi:hypothetical protein